MESWQQIIRLVREWRANIVIGHRSWDDHPDHR
jgi:LmbE family N-acetylglucosaminyl deacetylase